MIRPAAAWGSIYEDRRDRQTRDVQPRRRIWQAERNPGFTCCRYPLCPKIACANEFRFRTSRSVLYQMQVNVDLFQF